MSETKKKAKNDAAAAYSTVVGAAELQTVSLVNLNFAVQPQFFAKRDEAELGYDIEVDEVSYNDEAGQALAIIDCAVYASVGDEKLFNCEAKYIVVYSLTEACDKKAVTSFLTRVAVFACYPYFRSTVASIDWSAGTRLPPMPVHREANAVQARKAAAIESEN